MSTESIERRGGFAQVVAWGAYLACSWTWCIGMFLPVLLIRDFGYASFFVFAVPNVVGAMLMGVVLAKPGASEAFVARHRMACVWFSAVTLAFQIFFWVWLLKGMLHSSSHWVAIGTLVPWLVLLRPHDSKAAAWAAVLLLLVSAGCGLVWAGSGMVVHTEVQPALPPRDLIWMAPVCLFGFALCPYLDLTFHAARQRVAGRAGSLAFVVGFGVFFLLMILMTLAYAGPLIRRAIDARLPVQPGLLDAPLLLHVAAQLMFTACLHARAIRNEPRSLAIGASAHWFVASLGGLIGMLLGAGAGKVVDPEVVYRCFMAFYGLVFPAYVWICVVARGELTKRALGVFAGAVVVATPFYWMGFIERATWWLGPGVLIVIVARWVVGKGARESAAVRAS